MRRDRQKNSGRTKRSALCILLLCWAFFLFPGKVYGSEDFQVTEMHMQGEITASSSLNVRSGPGKNYSEIGKVDGGAIVTITGQAENGWYQIEINGETGYVSDDYVTATEIPAQEESEELEEEAGEPEEGYRGLNQSPAVIKMAVTGLGIIVVLGMLAVTLKGIRKDKEYDDGEEDIDDDEYDDDRYEDAPYEDSEYDEGGGYEDDVYGGGESEDDRYDNGDNESEDDAYEDDGDGYEEDAYEDRSGGFRTGRSGKKEYVLREEDYRVMIDPSFFEKEPIEQPAMVTGYLERQKIEEAVRLKEAEADRLSGGVDALQKEGVTEGGSEADKQRELAEAMAKLNELQKEIERLKKQKDE